LEFSGVPPFPPGCLSFWSLLDGGISTTPDVQDPSVLSHGVSLLRFLSQSSSPEFETHRFFFFLLCSSCVFCCPPWFFLNRGAWKLFFWHFDCLPVSPLFTPVKGLVTCLPRAKVVRLFPYPNPRNKLVRRRGHLWASIPYTLHFFSW